MTPTGDSEGNSSEDTAGVGTIDRPDRRHGGVQPQQGGSQLLVRILDLELRPHGIRANAVVPQLLDTAANRTTFPAELVAHATAPEAVVNVIAFLTGDLAAPVSGAIVPAYGA